MDTLSRLNGLVGKEGLLKTNAGELRFTFRAVHAPDKLLSETDDDGFQQAVNLSEFTVEFEVGTLVDGSRTKRASGFYISRIYGDY